MLVADITMDSVFLFFRSDVRTSNTLGMILIVNPFNATILMISMKI